MDFRKFKRACFERLNKVLPDLAGKKWDELLRKALETLTVESVPEDASPEGQFWDLLEQFCNGRAQAYSRIELTGGKPLTEDGRVFFKIGALMHYLDRMRFRHLNLQRVAAVLASRGGEASKITLSPGKQIRVWSVPAFTSASGEIWPMPPSISQPERF
jgi:hypothetical protein